MGKRISEVMTRDVKVIAPNETVQKAAQLMDELNVGSLPVCDGKKLVGMITDRDITIRATSTGKSPTECKVSDAMSAEVRYCYDDDDVADVVQKMSDSQIRRVPVIRRDDRSLIGIVALGDLATDFDASDLAAGSLQDISDPSQPERSA